MGSATVQCRQLVGGHAFKHESKANFIPIPALWDWKGIRMGLEDDRHPQQPVASANMKLVLSCSLL